MGKLYTHAHQSKPLLILSLVVSLFLHLGGFYLLLKHPPTFLVAREVPVHEIPVEDEFATQEILSELILREEEQSGPAYQYPQIESGEIPFIITEQSFTPELHYFAHEPKLDIKPYSPALVGKPLKTPKTSPFSGKKWINFSREIVTEETQELTPAPYIAEQAHASSTSNPDLEDKSTKHGFVKETLSLPIQPENLPSSSPLQFNLQQDSSNLIGSEMDRKKHKNHTSSSLSEPLANSSQLKNNEKTIVENSTSLSPGKEDRKKHHFDDDNFRFSVTEPLPKTKPFDFDARTKAEQPLTQSTAPSPKQHLPSHPDYATEYFSSLEYMDFSSLKEEAEEANIHPKFEDKQALLLSKNIDFSIELESKPSSYIPFQYEASNVSLLGREMHKEKLAFSKKALPNKLFIVSPYLDLWKQEPAPIERSYCPLREESPTLVTKDTFSPITLQIETSSEVIPLGLPEHDATITFKGEKHFEKQSTSFQSSTLTLQTPTLDLDTVETYSAASPKPTSEEKTSLTQSESALEISIEKPQPRSEVYFSDNEEVHLPLMPHSMEFPRTASPKNRIHVDSSIAIQSSVPITTPEIVRKDAHEYEPSLERKKTPLATSALPTPHIALSQKSLAPSLDTTTKATPHLDLQKPLHAKQRSKHLQELELDLPLVKNRTLQRPEGKNITIYNRPPQFSQLGNILSKEHAPAREKVSQPPQPQPLVEPARPSFYPPEVPALAFKDTKHFSLKEEHLEYIKSKTSPGGIDSEDLPLPYLSRKRVTPGKQKIEMKQALEGILSPDSLIAMVPRPLIFPNTLAILSESPCPSKITQDSPLSPEKITKEEIALPEVNDIHSRAEEIVAHYDQENRASAGLVALANLDLDKNVDSNDLHTFNKSHRLTEAFLSEIPTPSRLETVSFQNEFETEVYYTERDDGQGYYFALKMKPTENLYFEAPEQNIIYVVDGSSSIKKGRFNIFKEGVIRSLPYLKEGDTFNIIIADAEFIPMSKKPLASGRRASQAARKFLESRTYRGFFINYDAFDLISKVTPFFDPNKENVVVLLTDGNSLNSIQHHKKDLQKLANAELGNFSIFTASANQHNNLSMLDVLTTFNNGETMYAKTNVSFPRKLAVLVKHIGNFVAKDIHIQVASNKQETDIEFYPNEQTLPSLYCDKPYMVYGSVKDLKDFDIVMQGRTSDRYVNIKQHITFKNAEKATYAMKRNVALQKAYTCYDYFLQKDDSFFLSEAENLLEPFSMPSAAR